MFVDGSRELVDLQWRRFRTHASAASRTQGLDARDAELAATVAELLEQPTVARVDDPLIRTSELRPGDNTTTVRTSSSLNNRLLARGYYDTLPDVLANSEGWAEPRMQTTHVRDHGLIGPVLLYRAPSRG